MSSEVKFVEIRDSGTFIPAMAVRFTGDRSDPSVDAEYVVRRAGYNSSYGIALIRLHDGKGLVDQFEWSNLLGFPDRTMTAVHQWLYKDGNFDAHRDGAVIDVEFILGETPEPKTSERFGDEYRI